MSLAWQIVPNGLRLAVQLVPGARQASIEGIMSVAEGRSVLKVRINAPPVDGAANAALIAYLAKLLAVRKRNIDITSGAISRHKILLIAGDGAALSARLAILASTASLTRAD
jgi:uncharacterized protein